MRIHLATASAEPELSTNGPCSIFPSAATLRGRLLTKLGPVKAGARNGGLNLGADVFACDSLKIVPEPGISIKVEGKTYPGSLRLVRSGDKLQVINLTDLESYLLGVLGGEMPSSWPIEALKAQAVAARTYALYHRDIRASSPWDLTSTVEDQVYRGGKPARRIREAVSATRGIVLLHEGNPFPAFFHSTCGGKTESPAIALGRPEFDFIRGVTCGYCRESPHYEWTTSFAPAQISRLLAANGVDAGSPINRIDVVELEESAERLVKVTWADGETTVTVTYFRKAVGRMKVKSGNFTCRTRSGLLVFTGHGLGHGTGMCQYGARGMALANKSYDRILKAYYHDAVLKKLY